MEMRVEHGGEGIDKDVDTFIVDVVAWSCPWEIEREGGCEKREQ